jgi:hypothetical protein
LAGGRRWLSAYARGLVLGTIEINLMLGVKCDNRKSFYGPKKVTLTPNIGLEANPKPAQAGQEDVVDESGWRNDQRQSTDDVLPRTNFDN